MPAEQTEPAAERVERAVEDLVVVAEFRDPIYPDLVSTGKVQRGGDTPFHTVINAENFHALRLLLYTHEGKVDAIYIDPPHNNTGPKDWKYNNDYVDADDAYRHSKWLAFMERRLKLARRLLNPELGPDRHHWRKSIGSECCSADVLRREGPDGRDRYQSGRCRPRG